MRANAASSDLLRKLMRLKGIEKLLGLGGFVHSKEACVLQIPRDGCILSSIGRLVN